MLKTYFSDHMGAYDLLALAIEETWGRTALPPMARGPYGKPFFPDCPDLSFNVSHSGPLVLCAVGDEEVGADIECVRPRSAGLARYALTDAEFCRFTAAGGAWEDFYALWTAREAWSKYTGLGVARSRRRDIPPSLRVSAFVSEGWRGAVCARSAAGALLRR